MISSAAVRRTVVVLLVALLAAVAVLTVLTRDPWTAAQELVLVVLTTAGLVIVRKQPSNAVGWLLIAAALLGLVDAADRLYLILDYRRHGGTLPLGRVAVDWRAGLALTPFLVAFPSILLFPEGRAPSRRWRRALAAYVVAAAVFSLLQFDVVFAPLPQPLEVSVNGQVNAGNTGTAAAWSWILVPLFACFWVGSVAHQVRAWRRASGELRAQLKWLAGGSAFCVVGATLVVTAGDGTSPAARLLQGLGLLGVAAFPVAIGIGILRYRLYEIDRLISRTITYALVTGTLVGLFLGLVVLTTDVLPFSSPIGVAASTLAAAAVFNPLRVRVQLVVDRRFNRARYDAETTVEAFAQRLRAAVDLESVEAGLSDTVARAVEPAHLTVWIRSQT